jgi:glycosyltransferase involved in cell wall biosynthesis
LTISPQEREVDLLGVGSLIPLKQYDIFLEVVAEIKNQIPEVKALLVGKGPRERELQSLLDNLNLESNVKMTRRASL